MELISSTLTLIFLSLSLVLTAVRLIRGPSLADRVVALDLLSFQAMGLIGVYVLITHQEVFIDAAGVLVLVAFLATIAYARHLERHIAEGER